MSEPAPLLTLPEAAERVITGQSVGVPAAAGLDSIARLLLSLSTHVDQRRVLPEDVTNKERLKVYLQGKASREGQTSCQKQ